MLLQIILLIGFVSFIYALFDKWGFWRFLQEKSAFSGVKLFYDLASCELCLTFHLSLIIYGLGYLIGCFDIQSSLMAIIASNGLIYLIKK